MKPIDLIKRKRARAGENDLFFIKCAIIFLIVVLVAVL